MVASGPTEPRYTLMMRKVTERYLPAGVIDIAELGAPIAPAFTSWRSTVPSKIVLISLAAARFSANSRIVFASGCMQVQANPTAPNGKLNNASRNTGNRSFAVMLFQTRAMRIMFHLRHDKEGIIRSNADRIHALRWRSLPLLAPE